MSTFDTIRSCLALVVLQIAMRVAPDAEKVPYALGVLQVTTIAEGDLKLARAVAEVTR